MPPPPLLPHDPHWQAWFATERDRVLRVIGPWTTSLDHIGATAVPGMLARPTLDVMVGVPSAKDAFRSVAPLQSLGFSHRVLDTTEGFHLRFSRRLPSPVELDLLPWGSLWFIRAVAVRAHLRKNEQAVETFNVLKRAHAAGPHYDAVKLSFLKEIWAEEGWARSEQA